MSPRTAMALTCPRRLVQFECYPERGPSGERRRDGVLSPSVREHDHPRVAGPRRRRHPSRGRKRDSCSAGTQATEDEPHSRSAGGSSALPPRNNLYRDKGLRADRHRRTRRMLVLALQACSSSSPRTSRASARALARAQRCARGLLIAPPTTALTPEQTRY